MTRRIRRRGEHGISRKTIARGMPGLLRCTCGDYTRVLTTIAHEAAGALGTRHSLRPLLDEGQDSSKPRAQMRCENADTYSVVITRLVRNCALGRVIQYSRDVND